MAVSDDDDSFVDTDSCGNLGGYFDGDFGKGLIEY